MALQLIILPNMSWLKNGCPIGMSLNDSITKPKEVRL
jgi:hypothetical protein